ncbi:hypothetical protein V5799_006233 [Amblyomma americanum]|uniref:Secreted protein n=1 Tax=Amblyomma americanum TaxID=6943 RepID=A0AAQ4DWZ5_AMBAM
MPVLELLASALLVLVLLAPPAVLAPALPILATPKLLPPEPHATALLAPGLPVLELLVLESVAPGLLPPLHLRP